MALLARMVNAPLFIEVRRGAVAQLGAILADRRISAGGRVAVVVGGGQGPALARPLAESLAGADVFGVRGGSVDVAVDLVSRVGSSMYDAIIGIGGGRTLDVTKWAATRLGLPMISVATNLAHDGIASPVSSLIHDGGKGSFGVSAPIAVIVDLDFVGRSPPAMVRAGIGDVVSNLSAIADWELARQVRSEPVDGLAVMLAHTAAESILHRPDGIESDAFLTVLAEALVLSGMAMVAAGSSRPCSGADHEIIHAVEHLYPGAGSHGEVAGVGALFASRLRADEAAFRQIGACLRRHRLPCLPGEIGLSEEQFTQVIGYAPQTRPDRYTILEHLELSEAQVRTRVHEFGRAVAATLPVDDDRLPVAAV